MSNSILIVEDDNLQRQLLEDILKNEGFKVIATSTAEKGLKILSNKGIELLITDVRLPGMNGLDLLTKVKKEFPQIQVIVITAFGDVASAVEALKKGAFYYLVKPYEPEILINLVKKALLIAQLEKKVNQQTFDNVGIVYKSKIMENLLKQLKMFAQSPANILIIGESGTGKELLARFIYKNSNFKDNFVAVNCAAIPEGLFESSFFGYEKGAFTGADTSKKGFFQEANKGVLFLDEITAMPMQFQAKLLRVLQEREIIPLGKTKPVKIDLKIVAATNENIEKLVEEGKFREDLYFRLSVFKVKVPPLRERKEDIVPLTAYFIEKFSKEYNKTLTIEPEALEKLLNYEWPGNVRELENEIHKAVVIANEKITPEYVLMDKSTNANIDFKIDFSKPLPKILEEIEKRYIEEALKQSGYVQTKAAKLLGIDEKSLRYKRKKYNI